MISQDRTLTLLLKNHIKQRLRLFSLTYFLIKIEPFFPIVFASNAATLTASRLVCSILGLIMATISVRLLGPVDYGIAIMVMAGADIFRSFTSIKSSKVTIRYIAFFNSSREFESLKSICKLGYFLDFSIFTAVAIVINSSSHWIAVSIMNKSDIVWLMCTYAASFPFLSLTGTSRAIIASFHLFRLLAALEILESTVTLIAVSCLLLSNFGVKGLVLGIATGNVIAGLVMLSSATLVLHQRGVGLWWQSRLSSVAPLAKELTAFFGWNYFLVTVTGMMGQLPVLLLGQLRGPEEAGFYRLTTSIMTIGSYPETSLGRVAYPLLATDWRSGETVRLDRMLKRWSFQIGLPVGILLLLTTPFLSTLVPLVFGPAYSPMVLGTQLTIISAALVLPFFWLNPFYYASGKIAQWTIGYTLYGVLTLSLSWIFIRWWGFIGLVWLITVSKVLFTLIMTIPVFSHWKRT